MKIHFLYEKVHYLKQKNKTIRSRDDKTLVFISMEDPWVFGL